MILVSDRHFVIVPAIGPLSTITALDKAEPPLRLDHSPRHIAHILGRDPAPRELDPDRHGERLADPRQAGVVPEAEWAGVGSEGAGRVEKMLFTLEWLQDPALRRRVTVGLNKGEARNALAKAVFFNRLGEVRDRSYED